MRPGDDLAWLRWSHAMAALAGCRRHLAVGLIGWARGVEDEDAWRFRYVRQLPGETVQEAVERIDYHDAWARGDDITAPVGIESRA